MTENQQTLMRKKSGTQSHVWVDNCIADQENIKIYEFLDFYNHLGSFGGKIDQQVVENVCPAPC
jgi:hypothetical protein